MRHGPELLPIIAIMALLMAIIMPLSNHMILSKTKHIADTIGEPNRPGYGDGKWDLGDERAVLKAMGSLKATLREVRGSDLMLLNAKYSKPWRFSLIGIIGIFVAGCLQGFGFFIVQIISETIKIKKKLVLGFEQVPRFFNSAADQKKEYWSVMTFFLVLELILIAIALFFTLVFLIPLLRI